MSYFSNITTIEALKDRYKSLAKELHPDMGGDSTAFQAMMEEYTQKMEELTSTPFFLSEEYVGLGKALCGIAKAKRPETYAKAAKATKAVGELLSLFGNKKTNDIKSFIDKLEL